jgi:hypothetical protein
MAIWAPLVIASAISLVAVLAELRGRIRLVALGTTLSVVALAGYCVFRAPYEPVIYFAAAAPALAFVGFVWVARGGPRRA